MNGSQSFKSGQMAGILYIVMAVLSLLGFLINPYTRSFWVLLEVAAYGYLGALLLCKRRDFLISIGMGVLAILALRGLFLSYGLVNKLVFLLQVLAYVAMALFTLTDFVPSLKDTAKKYWFLPAGAMVVCIVPLFLSGVFNWLFNGWPFFQYFLLSVVTGIIQYGLLAAGLYFTAAWMVEPENVPGGIREPFQQSGYGAAAPQGPRAGSAGAPNTAPAGAAAAGNGQMPAGAYCGLAKHVLLLLFTLGIWYFIWIYRTTDNLNCLEDEPPRSPTTKLLLCMFIPFYSIYWVYKSAQRIDRLSAAQGMPSDSATLCLILAIFIGIVPPILMQDKINAIVTAQGNAPQAAAYTAQPQAQPRVQQQPQPQAAYQAAPQRPQAAPQTGVSDPVEEVKKYKELLDMGAITQEEYDIKKKQLLGL